MHSNAVLPPLLPPPPLLPLLSLLPLFPLPSSLFPLPSSLFPLPSLLLPLYSLLNTSQTFQGPALRNTEKALMAMWQHCQPNARRMPSAAEICEGKSERIGWLIAEVFDIFVMRDMRTARRCLPMMKWYSGVLSHYGITLSARTTAAPFKGRSFQQASWTDFRSGVALACVLHYFCGTRGAAAMGLTGMDLTRVRSNPRHAKHYHDNIAVVFETLLRMRMPLIWTVDNFIAFPDSDFLIWQLHCIYLMFRDMDCGLPFVENEDDAMRMESEPVITVDPGTGIAHVINLTFLDTDKSLGTPAFIDNELVGRTVMSNPLRGVAPGGEIDRRLATRVPMPAVTQTQARDPFGALDSPSRPSNFDMGPVLSPVDILYGNTPPNTAAEPASEEDGIVWDHLKEETAKSGDKTHTTAAAVGTAGAATLPKTRHGRVHSIAGAGGDTVVVTSKKVLLPPNIPPPPPPPAAAGNGGGGGGAPPPSPPPLPAAPPRASLFDTGKMLPPPPPPSTNSGKVSPAPPRPSFFDAGEELPPPPPPHTNSGKVPPAPAPLPTPPPRATPPPVDKRTRMNTQIEHLREERMEIEALSEQLTLSKPDGVQGMLDACRLTELRLMCIEEERRLTVMLASMPKVDETLTALVVSSAPKKARENMSTALTISSVATKKNTTEEMSTALVVSPVAKKKALPPRAPPAARGAGLPPRPLPAPLSGRGTPPPRAGRGGPPARPPGRGGPPARPPGAGRGAPPPKPRGLGRGELVVPMLARPPPPP
jgi:hypothetical protein